MVPSIGSHVLPPPLLLVLRLLLFDPASGLQCPAAPAEVELCQSVSVVSRRLFLPRGPQLLLLLWHSYTSARKLVATSCFHISCFHTCAREGSTSMI